MFFKRKTYCVHHNFILLLASHSTKHILTKQYTAILRKIVEKNMPTTILKGMINKLFLTL